MAGMASRIEAAIRSIPGGFARRFGPGPTVMTGGVLLALSLLAAFGAEMASDYREIEANACQTASNLARVLAAQTEAVMSTVDQASRHVVAAMLGRALVATPDDPSLHQMLRDITSQVPFVRDVYIFDASGNAVQMSAAHPVKTLNVADREYFQFHRDHPGRDLHVGVPVMGRLTGQWVIVMSRRLDALDGSFAGVAAVVLDPEYLQRLYDSIVIGRYGVVSLVRLDGRMLARSPFDPSQFAVSLANAPLFHARVKGGQRSGVDKGRFVSDGRVRISAFQTINVGSLLVNVAIDKDEALADWYQTTWLYSIAIAMLLGLMAVMVGMLRIYAARRERAEAARRESERLALSTIEALTTPLAVLDAEGTVIVANRAWRSVAGSRSVPGTAVGVGSNFLIACDGARGDDAAAAFAAGIRAVMAGQRSEHVQDFQVSGPDGLEWYAGRVTRFARTGPIRVVVLQHDVTARRMIENSLRQAMLEAEIANRAKAEFLATMSHELNTPLNAVIGFSEMIADQVYGVLGNRRYLDFARVINQSGRHLQQTIADILDIAKIDGGQMPLEEEPLDIAEVIGERMQHFVASAANGGITLEMPRIEAQVALLADRRMIKQILRTLISNAIKFTPRGGAVTVSASRAADGRLCLVIADTGVGMAPEDIPRAFDRFSQLDGTLSRRHEGTGLGLSLAKALTEKHGGTLEIISALGRGTTARVWFPSPRVLKGAARDAEPA